MLVLSRKAGESVVIGGDITVTVLDVQDHRIKLGIQAPLGVSVERAEVLERADATTPGRSLASCAGV